LYGWNTCFTARSTPPCQGMTRCWPLSRKPGTSKPVLHSREKCLSPISAVDLLSRESVKPPSSRAWSSRSADPRDLDRASDPARLYRTKHDPSTSTQANRCRYHLPRVASRFGADFASCGPVASTLAGSPGRPKQTHAGVINPCASRDCKTTGVPFTYAPTLVAQNRHEG
jgi:hypothetical protein